MEKPELPKEPNIVLRLLCFLLGLLFFVLGAIVGIVGLILWKWLHFPRITFTVCSIPIMLSIFFFGYSFFGNQDAMTIAQKPLKQPYLKHGEQKDLQFRKRTDGTRISIIPVPGGREVSGECVNGYYTEHSGSADV